MPCRILTPDSHARRDDGHRPRSAARRATSWSPRRMAGRNSSNLLKDTEFYIGAGQFKHGPEFYRAGARSSRSCRP